jgi:hypothetical protein
MLPASSNLLLNSVEQQTVISVEQCVLNKIEFKVIKLYCVS